MTITGLLGLQAGGVVAVVGCGGKTSLINLLAARNHEKKVLISPTTQMFPLTPGATVLTDLDSCIAHRPHRGVQQMGVLDNKTGKLKSLPLDVLHSIAGRYDLTLLEADGSAGKPMKGWQGYEPVVPAFCTDTVGICSISALGLPVLPGYVHRPDCFSRLTGLKEGDVVGIATLAEMVCANEGMFWNAVGRQILIVNQAEDDAQREQAVRLLEAVHGKQPSRFAELVYGSVHGDKWTRWNRER